MQIPRIKTKHMHGGSTPKKMNILLKALFTVLFNLACLCQLSAQQSSTNLAQKDTSTYVYTFKKAMEFEACQEYKKAIWLYINLFTTNPDRVLKRVTNINVNLYRKHTLFGIMDSTSIYSLIDESFGFYAALDPEIRYAVNGEVKLNNTKLKLKKNCKDKLILGLKTMSKALNKAEEYMDSGRDKVKLNDLPGALTDFSKGIAILPINQLYFSRGMTKAKLMDHKGAIDDFSKAIELNYYMMAQVYFSKGLSEYLSKEWQRSIDDFSKTIELGYFNVAASHYGRGLVKRELKDTLGAMDDFSKAIELNFANKAEVYYIRARCKEEMKDPQGAIQDYSAAIDLVYIRMADAYCGKAFNEETIKDFQGAMDDYSSAILIDSTHFTAYYYRANLRIKVNDLSEALKDLNIAIGIVPKKPEAYLSRGYLKYHLKDKDGACRDIKTALKLGAIDDNNYIIQSCK